MPRRAILIVDHGSRLEEANVLLESVAAMVRDRVPQTTVRIAHMELATPTIAEGLEACVRAGAGDIIVVPYFLVAGRHATEDVPRLVREAAAALGNISVRIAEPLGPHRLLAELVVERAGLDRERFALWRQDRAGERTRVETFDALPPACTELIRLTRLAPEQTYWLERER